MTTTMAVMDTMTITDTVIMTTTTEDIMIHTDTQGITTHMVIMEHMATTTHMVIMEHMATTTHMVIMIHMATTTHMGIAGIMIHTKVMGDVDIKHTEAILLTEAMVIIRTAAIHMEDTDIAAILSPHIMEDTLKDIWMLVNWLFFTSGS